MIIVKRRCYCKKYPAVLFLLMFINFIAYADSRVSGQRAAGGVETKNKAAKSTGDIIAANEYRGYEYYRNLDRNRPPSSGTALPSNKAKVSKAGNKTILYTIKKGDTLFRIAKNHKTTVEEISSLNNLGNHNRIYAGMKLKIPVIESGGKKSANLPKKKNEAPVYGKGGEKGFSFLWPLKKVDKFKRDGDEGVKAIGIIITGPARSMVIASESGVVKRAGYMRGFGKYVVVNHGNRYLTVYSNLMVINVKEGERVGKGGNIGLISDDRTLHFQIDYAGKSKNPLEYLPKKS